MPDINDVFKSVFPDREISAESDLLGEGAIDSIDIVLIVDEIEKMLGVSVPGDKVTPENFKTIVAIQALVDASSGAEGSLHAD